MEEQVLPVDAKGLVHVYEHGDAGDWAASLSDDKDKTSGLVELRNELAAADAEWMWDGPYVRGSRLVVGRWYRRRSGFGFDETPFVWEEVAPPDEAMHKVCGGLALEVDDYAQVEGTDWTHKKILARSMKRVDVGEVRESAGIMGVSSACPTRVRRKNLSLRSFRLGLRDMFRVCFRVGSMHGRLCSVTLACGFGHRGSILVFSFGLDCKGEQESLVYFRLVPCECIEVFCFGVLS